MTPTELNVALAKLSWTQGDLAEHTGVPLGNLADEYGKKKGPLAFIPLSGIAFEGPGPGAGRMIHKRNNDPKFVYVAQNLRGEIKLGVSVDPLARCRALTREGRSPTTLVWQTISPHESGPSYHIETTAQNLLRHTHLSGEWFVLDQEKVINSVITAIAMVEAEDFSMTIKCREFTGKPWLNPKERGATILKKSRMVRLTSEQLRALVDAAQFARSHNKSLSEDGRSSLDMAREPLEEALRVIDYERACGGDRS